MLFILDIIMGLLQLLQVFSLITRLIELIFGTGSEA